VTEPTAEQPQVTATVSPAAPPRSRWGAIPHHLGRARTSTVVLSLLFLGIGALWLNIRPDPVGTVPAGGGSVVEQPAAPTTAAVPETAEPTTAPLPTTDAATPTTTSEAPTTTSPELTPPEETTRFTTSTEPPVPSETLPEPTVTPTG
jgi:hypothetical protein